jgi:hypothetical protein
MEKTKQRVTASRAKNHTSLDTMVLSHERALFGYTDRDSLSVVPGLLEKIADANGNIDDIKKSVVKVEKAIAPLPEIVQLARAIKRWGAWGTAAIIALLLSIVLHQYGLLPLILHALVSGQ